MLHLYFFFYMCKKVLQYERLFDGFDSYKRFCLYWAFNVFFFLFCFEKDSSEAIFLLPFNSFHVVFAIIYVFIIFLWAFEIWARSLWLYTPDWWNSTEVESYVVYLRSIKKSIFLFASKDQWFDMQLNFKKSVRRFKIFSNFILLLLISVYFIFFFSVIFAFQIDIYYILTYLFIFKVYFFFCLVYFYFFFLLLRSWLGIPNSWFFLIFEIHIPGEYYDRLNKWIAWLVEAMVHILDADIWWLHPLYFFAELWGREEYIDLIEYMPYLEEEATARRFFISREWLKCNTLVFDCITYNSVFTFFSKTHYFLTLMITTRFGRNYFPLGCDNMDVIHIYEPNLKQYVFDSKKK